MQAIHTAFIRNEIKTVLEMYFMEDTCSADPSRYALRMTEAAAAMKLGMTEARNEVQDDRGRYLLKYMLLSLYNCLK